MPAEVPAIPAPTTTASQSFGSSMLEHETNQAHQLAAPRRIIVEPPKPPFPPMEAESVDEIPRGEEWQYEPKWDGFRCLAFRDGDHVELQSKAGQPLARYFPDLVTELKSLKAKRFVLDGEIVIPIAGRLSFDELLLRIHPAAS